MARGHELAQVWSTLDRNAACGTEDHYSAAKDEMIMKDQREPSGIPAGYYGKAQFMKADPFDERVSDYGPAVRLTWKVLEGDHKGQEASRILSAKLSPKSNLFKFVTALGGRRPEPGEAVNLNRYLGTVGMIVVERTESGASRVTSFIKTQ